ncbi:MAG: hypothetical protein EPN60_05995 [Nevskiaceae bacterium]|nr:MAG: hypothetical protein EPN60_05995 [Nevskiaceae bacterium]
MRRTFARVRVLAAAAATAVLVHTTAAQALGLGEINVDSLLNQRFSASIPLYEIDAEDLETLTMSLAPAEAFDRAGLERSDYLSSLEFLIKNDQGKLRVVVSSSQIAREPVMNLLVQARWSGGKLLREYTVLLDPPQLALPPAAKPIKQPKPAIEPQPPAPVVAPVPAPVAVAKPSPAAKAETEFYETSTEAPPKAPAKPAPAPARPPAARPEVAVAPALTGAGYGPVKAQETLWSIATRVRPDASVSMDQVMYALALANPKTIQRGTTVNKGAILSLPAPDAMLANSPAEAKAGLAALRKTGTAVPKADIAPPKSEKAAAPSPPASKPSSAVKAPVASAMPAPAVVSKPAPPPATPAAKPSEPPPATPTAKPSEQPPAVPTKPLVKSVAEAFPSAVKPEPAKPATPAPAPADVKPAPPAAPVAKPSEPPPATKIEPVVTKPVVAAAPAPTAAEAPKSEAAPAPAASNPPSEPKADTTVTAPASPAPSLSQPLPEAEEGTGILASLSSWALPAGGLLALVLIGLVGSRMLTSGRGGKKSSRVGSDAQAATTLVAAAAATTAGSSNANPKLGDTLVDATRPAQTPAMEQTQAITQSLEATAAASKPSAFESTLVIQPEMAASLHNAAAPSHVGQKKTDFDMTTQLQAETLHIDLDANDPISEADFHLAYGLYDEAILLLKQALGKTPARDDLRVKLAETYFAAGKPMEFQALAEELKPRLSAAEWSKIAIMGSQLCPTVALFKADAGAELVADFDLGFDEPDMSLPPEPIHSIPAPLSPPPSPLPPPIVIETPSLDLAPLELPEMPIPAMEEVVPPPAAPSPVEFKLELDPALVGDVKDIPEEDPDSIDFMLGQSITPLGAASASPPPALDSNLLEFDLDSSMNRSPANAKVKAPGVVDELPGLDFQLSLAGDAPQSSLAPAAAAGQPEPELDLSDFEISLTPREMDAGSVEDEFNTKLDLARAYVEMGDNEMARGLLQEVQQQGNSVQKGEASSLLERLPA